MRPEEIDTDTLVKHADAALTRPSDYAAWDDRWYTTHGCVATWADRGDDILAESNYHAMLAALNGAVAHDETGASEARGDDVEDSSASHWAVGSLRQLMVRVRDDAGEFTPAFREAVACALALQEYPLLDESDYSERETEAWFKTFDLALDDAVRAHRDVDSPIDEELIKARMSDDRYGRMPELGHPDEINWDVVQDAYDAYRAEYLGLAGTALAARPGAGRPGQSARATTDRRLTVRRGLTRIRAVPPLDGRGE
jgi:hypothetical protein